MGRMGRKHVVSALLALTPSLVWSPPVLAGWGITPLLPSIHAVGLLPPEDTAALSPPQTELRTLHGWKLGLESSSIWKLPRSQLVQGYEFTNESMVEEALGRGQVLGGTEKAGVRVLGSLGCK